MNYVKSCCSVLLRCRESKLIQFQFANNFHFSLLFSNIILCFTFLPMEYHNVSPRICIVSLRTPKKRIHSEMNKSFGIQLQFLQKRRFLWSFASGIVILLFNQNWFIYVCGPGLPFWWLCNEIESKKKHISQLSCEKNTSVVEWEVHHQNVYLIDYIARFEPLNLEFVLNERRRIFTLLFEPINFVYLVSSIYPCLLGVLSNHVGCVSVTFKFSNCHQNSLLSSRIRVGLVSVEPHQSYQKNKRHQNTNTRTRGP